jgi:hypothetical protein
MLRKNRLDKHPGPNLKFLQLSTKAQRKRKISLQPTMSRLPVTFSEEVFGLCLSLASLKVDINEYIILTSISGEPYMKILNQDNSIVQLGREIFSLLEGKATSIAFVTVVELFKTDWTLELHLEVKEDVFERLTLMQDIFKGHTLSLVSYPTF